MGVLTMQLAFFGYKTADGFPLTEIENRIQALPTEHLTQAFVDFYGEKPVDEEKLEDYMCELYSAARLLAMGPLDDGTREDLRNIVCGPLTILVAGQMMNETKSSHEEWTPAYKAIIMLDEAGVLSWDYFEACADLLSRMG